MSASSDRLPKVDLEDIQGAECDSLTEFVDSVYGPKTGGNASCSWVYVKGERVPANDPKVTIECQHLTSMGHLLAHPYDRKPGASLPQRTSMAYAMQSSAVVLDALVSKVEPWAIAVPERAWTYNTRRFFQGQTEYSETAKEDTFRWVGNLPPTASLIRFPDVQPGDLLVFCYHGCSNGMTQPHGISKNSSTLPNAWHVEPGGSTFLLITSNDDFGSTGVYMKVDEHGSYKANLESRLKWFTKKSDVLHDSRLMRFLMDRPDDTNRLAAMSFITCAYGVMPLCYAGKDRSDPLCIGGQGCHSNKKLLKEPQKGYYFRRDGTVDPRQQQWPSGIAVPDIIRDWMALDGVGLFLVDLNWLAHKYPKVFLLYFPNWDSSTRPPPAKKAKRSKAPRPRSALSNGDVSTSVMLRALCSELVKMCFVDEETAPVRTRIASLAEEFIKGCSLRRTDVDKQDLCRRLRCDMWTAQCIAYALNGGCDNKGWQECTAAEAKRRWPALEGLPCHGCTPRQKIIELAALPRETARDVRTATIDGGEEWVCDVCAHETARCHGTFGCAMCIAESKRQ